MSVPSASLVTSTRQFGYLWYLAHAPLMKTANLVLSGASARTHAFTGVKHTPSLKFSSSPAPPSSVFPSRSKVYHLRRLGTPPMSGLNALSLGNSSPGRCGNISAPNGTSCGLSMSCLFIGLLPWFTEFKTVATSAKDNTTTLTTSSRLRNGSYYLKLLDLILVCY